MSDLKDENSDEENADEKTCPEEEEEFNSSVNGIGDASENLGGVDAESVVNSEVGDVMPNGNGESGSNIPTKINLEESDNDKNLSYDGDKVSGLENNEKMKSETTSDDDDDDDDDDMINEQEETLSPEEQNNATSEVDNAYDSDEEPSLSIKEEEEPPLNEDTQANNIKSAESNSSYDLAESNVSQGEANNNNNNNHNNNNNNNSSSDKSTPVLDALPECRNKRSYICGYCNMKTNNPREYLYHLKDTHGESIKIFECSLCIYASKTHQKLVRHNHMVHKINIAPESSDHKKKSKEKDFKPSGNKKLKSSPMNRSPRESKSPRRFQEYEFMNDSEAELEESYATTKTSSSSGKLLYNCDQCSFSTFSTKVLAKHEIKFHLKRKFFKCTRCSYATQVKARYTKHMKYHQLPIIKCDWCDFRTPYRWNLDRHNKNHTEEIGEHKCHLCNFSAQIKQSLTVHIANHHLTPEQIKERESKRIIGVCDPEDFLEDEEMELLRMERDEDPDALELPESSVMASNQSFTVSNIDMGNQDDFESSVNGNEDSENLDEPKRKKPKIKITLKKMKPSKDTFPQEVNERHNFNEDFIHPDDVVQRHGNVYIKSEKCSLCSFKAPFLKEVQKHKRKVHGIHAIKTDDTKKNNKSSRSDKLSDSSENSSDSSSESAKRKYNEIADYASDKSDNFEYNEEFPIDNSEALNDQQIKSGEEEEEDEDEEEEEEEPSSKDSTPAKKKSSFFDKLQEKLSTSNVQNLVCQFCGHESKCLSESVRHQKLHLSVKNVYATPSLSTRCQFCRHRCKTTDDLMNHLKSCPEARKNQISDNMTGDINDDFAEEEKISPSAPANAENQRDGEPSIQDQDPQKKHPMENKVFVWNNISNFGEDEAAAVVVAAAAAAAAAANAAAAASAATTTTANNNNNNSNVPAEDTCIDLRSATPSEYSFSYRGESDNNEEVQHIIEGPREGSRKLVKKRVYRCPQCKYWAATASRFHVHIMGHYNAKPHRCSECSYRSNWRWDVSKHIKLKMLKDPAHQQAKMRLIDDIGDSCEKYEEFITEVRMNEKLASRNEGGTSSLRKARPKSKFETDSTETDSSKSSPCPTPLTISSANTSTITPSSGHSANIIPAPPKLMRAPNHHFTSSPGPNPFGPINPGAQMMVEMGSANNPSDGDLNKKKFPMKPPPLVAMGTLAHQQQQFMPRLQQHQQQQQQLLQHPDLPLPSSLTSSGNGNEDESSLTLPQNSRDDANHSGSNYQIITPQGALQTSLETLQLLAAGSTNLAKLKQQQKETGEGNNPELDAAVANQESESGSSSEPPISSIMQLVLDHEGNPEWKCLTCDFRDNEQETVIQHVRLAHGKKGPVSLLHAVHRCSVCGFAAGTKRHVQVHLETAHNGQGGIISRSEGQSIDPETGVDESNRSFDCRLCPFTCKKRGELKAHLSHHTPRVDFVFKCMFCPYYVATKSDLFNHLAVHGMNIPASVKEAVSENNTSAGIPTIINSASNDDASSRHFVCDLCPFETRSRAKLMHHRQFHRPRGLPFSCPHCSYNVTRRHLLAQHLRIHGVSPTEGLEIADNQGSKSKSFGDDSSFSRSKSPSPSLTITPISSGKDGDVAPSKIDPTCLPTLSDELTKNLHDIPLVWVSRDGRFFKMFKCRHCPHVNLRKTNIQEHEKMHRTDGLVPGTGHACQYCSYICINAGVMSAHLKVHSGSMGKCHAIVDQALPNEEQLHMLAGSAMKKAMAGKSVKQGDEKLLYYCQHCPGRFFFEKEVQIHSRFHQKNSNFTHHCPKCQFGARDESQILAHDKVHTTEYQERTRTLMSMHPAAPSFPPVQGLSVPQDLNKPVYGVPCSENDSSSSSKGPVNGFSRPWLSSPVTVNTTTSTSGNMPQPPPTSRFKCDQCPSTFSKLITLQYHQSLHSADNPFKCDRCTYAAKTQDGLQQHITLHEQADMEKESAKEEDSQKSSSPSNSAKKSLEETLSSLTGKKLKKDLMGSMQDSLDHPPIKLKLMKNSASSGNSKKQFKYYIEEQVPLSGVELLKRKNQIEREIPKDAYFGQKIDGVISCKSSRVPKAEDRCGNPNLHYPLHIDKSSGRTREKRYKCVRCPSAFEKLDQFNVHLNLHGSNYKYKCKICDYSVKFYANFMMHIKRHKYHERMDAQKKGLPLPPEDQMKYEPFIGDRPNYLEETRDRETFANDKENQFDFDAYPDMTTAEKQQIILQQKKADAFKLKDEDKDKKIFYCQYCPYANMRRDAVDSHSLRHQANMGRGVYQCNFCDYTASQPNFIREHTKVHFRPFKYVQSEGFMRHDKLEIWSIKSGELQDDDDTPKKMLVFGHEEGNFTPDFKESQEDIKPEAETETTSLESMDIVDSQAENGILVDFRSGDVVEAPSNFIIPLRPTKGNSKIVNGSGSGKCKSSKHMKARKKAKLSEPILDSVPQQKEENEEATKAENEEEEEDNGINKPELIKDESNALSPQEDTINNYNNSPSNSSSPATHNPENEEEAEANSDDPENENGDNCSGMEEVSPLKENYVTMTALSH